MFDFVFFFSLFFPHSAKNLQTVAQSEEDENKVSKEPIDLVLDKAHDESDIHTEETQVIWDIMISLSINPYPNVLT